MRHQLERELREAIRAGRLRPGSKLPSSRELADELEFMQELGRRNGGRVFQPKRGALGEFVVADYLSSRRGRRRAAG